MTDRLAVFVQETTQTVYNWQFVHSLSLWTRVVSELHGDESIQSLIYPLTQTIIGTIKSVHHFYFDLLLLLNKKIMSGILLRINC